MAIRRRNGQDGLVTHFDRGVQFISWASSQNVRDAGLAPSLGAIGSPYDNAMVEAFWAACKSSCTTARRGRRASSLPPRSTTTSSYVTTADAATAPSVR
jgi:transposase InsO family protein